MEFLREKGESSRQSKQQVGNSDVKADRVTKIVEDVQSHWYLEWEAESDRFFEARLYI